MVATSEAAQVMCQAWCMTVPSEKVLTAPRPWDSVASIRRGGSEYVLPSRPWPKFLKVHGASMLGKGDDHTLGVCLGAQQRAVE